MEKPPASAPERPFRTFHGRRHGKSLRPAQRVALEDLLPALRLAGVTWEENPERAPLDLAALSGGRPVWLEIGFGGGEHLRHLSAAHPDMGLIGCEPFVNGVAMLLHALDGAVPDNLRLHPGDVRDLFDVLPAGSIARAYLLYPDPWPKTRHHQRRFVTPHYLEPLARTMAPGAELRVATDIADYVRQALEEVPRAGFELVTKARGEGSCPWEHWPSTRYERKALRAGRAPTYLVFRRSAHDA